MNNVLIQKRSQERGFKKKYIGLAIFKEPTIPLSPNAPH
jgi:hypothetical protein